MVSLAAAKAGERNDSKWFRMLRRVVAVVGFGGALVFAAANAWSWIDPVGVERMAREAIRVELQERVDAGIASMGAPATLDSTGIAAVARRLANRELANVEAVRERMQRRAPELIDIVIANMLTPGCGCRDPERPKKVAGTLEDMYRASIAAGESAAAHLEGMIRGKYEDVAARLLREFRIFTATNAVVLVLLGIAVLVRRRAGAHLLPAAAIVVAATAFVSHAYLFRQDWLHTIVFADYMGLWFVGYVLLAALLLGDVLLNRAIVTVIVLNLLLAAVGAALSAC